MKQNHEWGEGSDGGVTVGPLFLVGADAGALGGFLLERLEENTWKGGGRLFAGGEMESAAGVWIQEILQAPSCRNLHGPS